MTPEEYTENVRRIAWDLVGYFGAIDQKRTDPAAVARMADKGMKRAMELIQQTATLQISAGLTAEQQDVAASGYDLAALANAPSSPVQE